MENNKKINTSNGKIKNVKHFNVRTRNKMSFEASKSISAQQRVPLKDMKSTLMQSLKKGNMFRTLRNKDQPNVKMQNKNWKFKLFSYQTSVK